MKLSVYLPRPGEYPDQSPDTIAELARALEELRYDAAAASDHPFPVVDGRGHQAYDPFIELATAAAATTRLKLHLSLAVAPYRNPFLLARTATTLHYVSRGRLILAAGSGYLHQEFAALGADFDERHEYTSETLRALRLAFTGEPVHDETRWWRADGNSLEPAPDPPLPLWLGGNSRWAIEQAVIHCDGWSPHEVTPEASRRLGTIQIAAVDELRRRLALLDEVREQHGREQRLEVCFVRGTPAWRSEPRQAILEELHALRELGVDWLCVRFHPETAAALVDEFAWFRELVDELA